MWWKIHEYSECIIFTSAKKIMYMNRIPDLNFRLHIKIKFVHGRHGEFEPGKVQYSTPNFFDRLVLIRAYWNPKSRQGPVLGCLGGPVTIDQSKRIDISTFWIPKLKDKSWTDSFLLYSWIHDSKDEYIFQLLMLKKKKLQFTKKTSGWNTYWWKIHEYSAISI